jgi:uncharacterized coiled-coil protein SlyX
VSDLETLQHTVSDFVDHKSVSEQRIVSLEFKGGKQNQVIEEIKQVVRDVKEERVKVQTDIDTLKQVKVNRDELQTKADVSVAMVKADQSEIERLEELSRELSRRLNSQTRDHSDALLRSQKDCEKKIDTVAQWCSKQMRLSNGESHTNLNTGGDIGKVRCLVCDQPIKQQTEQEVVFGGPQATHVLKSRKGSPPHGHERDRGRSPPPNMNNYHTNINNYHGVHGHTVNDKGNDNPIKQKNKLSKLLATPVNSNANSRPSTATLSGVTVHGTTHLSSRIATAQGSGPGIINDSVDMNDEVNAFVVRPPNDVEIIPLDIGIADDHLHTHGGLDSPVSKPIIAPRVTATKQPTIVSSLSSPALQAHTQQQQQLAYNNFDNREFVTDFTPKKDGAVTGADTISYFKELEGLAYVSFSFTFTEDLCV